MRTAWEIVQGHDAGDDRSKSCGNLRIARIRDVAFALDLIIPEIRSESGAYLGGAAREFNDRFAAVDFYDVEALLGQPMGNRFDVRVSRAVLRAKSFWAEPSVVVQRVLVLLRLEEIAQGNLLLIAALQKQQDAVNRQRIGNCAAVEFRAGQRMDIARQRDAARAIDRFDNPGGDRRLPRCQSRDEKEGEKNTRNSNVMAIHRPAGQPEFESSPQLLQS